MMKNCLICRNEIHRASGLATLKSRKSCRAVTCSPRCSRIYIRVNNYVRSRIRHKNEKVGK